MATTRSRKLRRSVTRKAGKRAVRPRKVTYRGLVHGAMADLSRGNKHGPRPIPQEMHREAMIEMAKLVGKPLPPVDWHRRYCARHIQAAITDGYFDEHEGGALSVTPKARYRYRQARRAARLGASLLNRAKHEKVVDFCLTLDKEVGPTSLKTKAELVAENRALAAKLNAPPTSARQPLHAWGSLSTVTNAARTDEMNVDVDDDDDDDDDFGCLVDGPSTTPMIRSSRNPYPSPESLPRAVRPKNDRHESTSETPTPCVARSTSQQLSAISPVSPPNELIAEGRIDFMREKADATEDDDDDVLILDMPGPCNLTLKFSAASLERRILELESDVEERDATIARRTDEVARLLTERDDIAHRLEELQNTIKESDTTEVIQDLNALIDARNARISALETECFSEKIGTANVRAELQALQRRYEQQNVELMRIAEELAASEEERRGLEAKIAELLGAAERATGQHQVALNELKEEYEVQLQLLRTQIDEADAKRLQFRSGLFALMAATGFDAPPVPSGPHFAEPRN